MSSAAMKPFLPRHRTVRREFAVQHLPWTQQMWSKCLITDECKAMLHSKSGRYRVWRRRGKRMGTTFLNCSRAFGGISITSRTELVVFRNRTVRGQDYLEEILRPIVRREADRIGNGFVFVDDNAPYHHARMVNMYLQEERIAYGRQTVPTSTRSRTSGLSLKKKFVNVTWHPEISMNWR